MALARIQRALVLLQNDSPEAKRMFLYQRNRLAIEILLEAEADLIDFNC